MKRRSAATRRFATSRRGFAMPVVIVLAMVAGIMAVVVLERQAAQRQTVSRQLNGYVDIHFERGVREVVGQWTDSLIGQPIEKLLGPDGHAMDIERPDGSVVAIYLFDGQGSALTEVSGLSESDAVDALGVMQELKARTGGRVDPGWIRPVGPVRVCVSSAPPEVLDAVFAYAKGGKIEKRAVQSLLNAQKRGEVTDVDLNTAVDAAGLTPEQKNTVKRILIVKPELWNTVVDVYQPGSSGLVARYGGRFLLSNFGAAAGGGAPGRSTSMVSLGKFLWWEPLPLNDDGPN